MASVYQWIQPQSDKAHRCPVCHQTADRAWTTSGYGPRTIFRCLYGCYVQWRSGRRGRRFHRSWRQMGGGDQRKPSGYTGQGREAP